MPLINLIQNGNFSAGSAGWTGTDLETSYKESAYLGNGSANRVAEMDGQTGQTTVMQQDITLSSGKTIDLTFRTALRSASLKNAGSEGFRVDILDASGTVIGTQTFFPTTTIWTAQTMSVTFPTGGTYTVRFTELGPNDSLGPIVDDISMLVCFVAGTLIATDAGERPVESLSVGDLVWTLDAGLQPVRWISRRDVSLAEQLADDRLCPVVFEPDALAPGVPLRRMQVSPQHRICLGDWRTELYFAAPEVLMAALTLVNGSSVHIDPPQAAVSYVHFLLDGHQIVRSDGALTESFYPSALALGGVDRAARDELLRLFPDLAEMHPAFGQTARRVLRGREVRLVA